MNDMFSIIDETSFIDCDGDRSGEMDEHTNALSRTRIEGSRVFQGLIDKGLRKRA